MKTTFECTSDSDFYELYMLLKDRFQQDKNLINHDTPIKHVIPDVRVQNFLLGNDINSLSDLLKLSEIDLLKKPHAGRKTIHIIIQSLALRGLFLRDHTL